MNRLFAFFLLFGLVSFSQLAYSQNTPDKKTYEINTVDILLEEDSEKTIEDLLKADVQTTDRIRTQSNIQAPATIVIVSEEQIRQRNYQSLLDLLQDQPDIKIDFGVDPRWMNDVSIRGIRGMDKFIILLDGVRISSPTNDIIPVMENYPVHFAKQVEIVYGPASALYGADAFSGVINIITKEASELEKVNLSVQGGMYNTFLGNIHTGIKLNERVKFTLSGQYFYDQQPDLSTFYPEEYEGINETLASGVFPTIFGDISSSETVFPDRQVTAISTYALQGNLDVDNFRFSFFRNNSTTPSTQALSPNNGVYNKGALFGHSVTMLSGRYNKQWDKLQSTTYLVGSQYNLNPLSNFRNVYTGINTAYLYSKGWMLKGEQLFNYNLSQKINLSFGGTYEYFLSYPRGHDLQFPIFGNRPQDKGIIVNSILPNNPQGIEADIPRIEYNNVGGLVQIQYSPLNNLTATIGTRFDYNSRFGGTFNPRLGLVWQANEKTTLKALYGSAFLAPSPQAAFDQFGTFFSFDNGSTYQSAFFRLPNPNLEPQLIQTAEISASTFINKEFSVGITGFYSSISGLFAFVPDEGNTNLYNNTYKGWPVGFIEVTINQGSQQNYGGTARVDYFKPFGNRNKISAYLMASFVTGTVNSEVEGDTISSREITSYTPIILRAGFDLTLKRLSISPRVMITGKQKTYALRLENPEERQELDGFALLNLNINYELPPYTSLFIDIDNLLDQRYRHVNLGAAPEAAIQGAASAEIAQGMPQYPIRVSGGVRFRF